MPVESEIRYVESEKATNEIESENVERASGSLRGSRGLRHLPTNQVQFLPCIRVKSTRG